MSAATRRCAGSSSGSSSRPRPNDSSQGERAYWQGVLDEFLRIRDEPTGHNKKARTFRIALEGGIRTVEARLAWLDDAIAEIRSPAWAELDPG